jgi:hypothetical protein
MIFQDTVIKKRLKYFDMTAEKRNSGTNTYVHRSRDSLAGIATGYGLDGQCLIPGMGLFLRA